MIKVGLTKIMTLLKSPQKGDVVMRVYDGSIKGEREIYIINESYHVEKTGGYGEDVVSGRGIYIHTYKYGIGVCNDYIVGFSIIYERYPFVLYLLRESKLYYFRREAGGL